MKNNQPGTTSTGGDPGAADSGVSGVSAEVVRFIDDRINGAFASWGKKELPKIMNTSMREIMTEVMEQSAENIGASVLAKIEASLPNDQQIDELMGGGGDDDDGAGAGDVQYRIPPELAAELNDLRKSKDEFDQFRTTWEQEREELAAQAEEENRHATIQAALNKYSFANDESREVAFRYFDTASERDEEGTLIGPGGLPIDKYVQERMGSLGGLLASRQVGGSGAIPAGARNGNVPTMEDIKPGMSAEQKASVLQHAVSQLPPGMRPGT